MAEVEFELTSPSTAYGDAALIYVGAGWRGVLPISDDGPWGVARGKHRPPKGVTGRNGVDPTREQIVQWARDFPHLNLGLRLPAGVIGIDVDAYDGKVGDRTLTELEARLGLLPATWSSTSRGDGPSRIRFYRVAEDIAWHDIGGDIEIIRRDHRFAVVWPSVHPDGPTYRWYDPSGRVTDEVPQVEQLPTLPDTWQSAARAGNLRVQSSTSGATKDGGGFDQVDTAAILRGELAGYPTHRLALIGLITSLWARNAKKHEIWPLLRAAADHPHRPDDPFTDEELSVLLDDVTKDKPPGPSGTLTDEEWARVQPFIESFGVPKGSQDDFRADLAKEMKRRVVRDAADQLQRERLGENARRSATDRIRRGGDFIFDEPEGIPAAWGDGERVLWAEGEGVMIVGHQGLGKTTVAQQLVLHRIGVRVGEFLGLTVQRSDRPGLYLAMDRPRQAARSFRRMVRDEHLPLLNERLVIWRGPLPVNPLASPQEFADFVERTCPGCGVVIVDSVKDLAPGIATDEVGSALNSSWQEVIARGTELVLLHHERKASGNATRLNTLDDVYGSTWLTSGLGSVIALNGQPGAAQVGLLHLKQPAAQLEMPLRHDHPAGTTVVYAGPETIREALQVRGDVGATAETLGREVLGKWDDAARKKTSRELLKLESEGRARRLEGLTTPSGRTPDTWHWVPANRRRDES